MRRHRLVSALIASTLTGLAALSLSQKSAVGGAMQHHVDIGQFNIPGKGGKVDHQNMQLMLSINTREQILDDPSVLRSYQTDNLFNATVAGKLLDDATTHMTGGSGDQHLQATSKVAISHAQDGLTGREGIDQVKSHLLIPVNGGTEPSIELYGHAC